MKREPVLINGVLRTDFDVQDRGMHYGDGVFRTIKAESGLLLWWKDHYQKLLDDCEALRIACPEEAMLHEEAQRIASMPEIGVIKIIITRGAGQRGYRIANPGQASRIVMGFTATAPSTSPLRARWCALKLGWQPALAGVKHLNRLENVLARSEWSDEEVGEGLLTDAENFLVCGTMSNVFLLERGRLFTPDLSRCGIAGVARARVLRGAERAGRSVRVEHIERARVEQAEALFICNSLMGIRQISQLESTHWASSELHDQLVNWLHG